MTTQREAWLHEALAAMRPWYDSIDCKLPLNIRLSCGFPSVGALAVKKRRIGECWSTESSKDKHTEIFVSPTVGDALTVTATLVHELIHAGVGVAAKHGKLFRRPAIAIGLEGKMTSTVPGEALSERLHALIEKLGKYPHAELSKMTNGIKKQGTRLIKLECPACGYTARTTMKWISIGLPVCPCGGEMEAPDLGDE